MKTIDCDYVKSTLTVNIGEFAGTYPAKREVCIECQENRFCEFCDGRGFVLIPATQEGEQAIDDAFGDYQKHDKTVKAERRFGC